MEFKEVKELPINPRIIEQMAKATVKNIVDAAVELITNCDDSYRRLEEQGAETTGRIEVFVSREKGGICRDFWLRDHAEGMTRDELEKAIEFGGETSGFEAGRGVRGLFGRGLKEAIISLGEAQISTIKGKTLNTAKVWWDKSRKKPLYGLSDEIQAPSVELRRDAGIKDGNGTMVKIKVQNEKIRVPECDNLKRQISQHYALRDINSSRKREVLLTFHDFKRGGSTRRNIRISFEGPEGELVCERKTTIPEYGDKLTITIFKSPTPLDSPRLNPFAKAGMLIKTEAAVLDCQLFKYETDPAALYFWGEVYCESIAERIKQGDIGIIDPNRGGIEWRHEYCQAIQAAVEKALDPLIQEKRRELEKPERKQVPEPTRKMLRRLCDLLNELARKEFDEWEPPAEPPGEIERLTLLPHQANLEVDRPRPLSVYAPPELVRKAGNKAIVTSDNTNIQPLSSLVKLEKHSKYPNLHYGVFKVVGRLLRQEAYISCRLGGQEDKAYLKVAEQKQKKKGKTPQARKGGFISNILPDEASNPIQRAQYVQDTGEIKIYINFPGVARYIGSGLSGAEVDQGRVILAELIGDAFCKALAMREFEEGKRPRIPGAEIDSFNSAVNELQRKYLDRIHQVVTGWKFK